MTSQARGCGLLILTLLFSTMAAAQTQSLSGNDTALTKASGSAKSVAYSNAVANDRSQFAAIAVIRSLVDKAERFQDLRLRAATQAKAADAIWEVDQEWARRLFQKAWETAETVDQEDTQKSDEARRTAVANRGGGLIMLPPQASMRSEVLQLATRHDPKLGDSFLKKLEEPKDDNPATSRNTDTGFFDPTEPKLAIAKRLEVALKLINAGDLKQAVAFAAPALSYTTSQGIIFLCTLRQQDAETANRMYSQLLTFAQTDPSADATTVSLLSSYVFTPTLLVTATRRGRVSNQFSESNIQFELQPELRSTFFRVAAGILLRPVPQSADDHTSAGRAGTYFTIARLLPLFQQYAPNYVSALNSQLTLLATDTPESYRNGQEGMLRLGLQTDDTRSDSIDAILDRLSDTAGNTERDTLYVQGIRAGAQKGDPRIRELADKIEDQKLRDTARAFADLAVIKVMVDRKHPQQALDILRDGRLSPMHRVWAITKISLLLERSDPVRAAELLEETTEPLASISSEDPQRVYALTCLANAFLKLNHLRSWALLQEATQAVNAIPNANVESPKLTAQLRTKNIIATIRLDEPSFSLVHLFELISLDDIDMALSTASRLNGEAPSAAVNLGIARAILKHKPQAVAARN